MPTTWVATPGSVCGDCGREGPIVHHCDGTPPSSLHCMLCHDSWRMSQITEAFKELAEQDYSVEGLDTDANRCWKPAPDGDHLCGLDKGHASDCSHPSLNRDWNEKGWIE